MKQKAVTISVCIIVKDEEKVIDRCLNSVQDIADEVVIIDTGSNDCTKEIVNKYTNKLFDFAWIDDFSAARNFAFSFATQDYILWLDADDVMLESDRAKFITLKHNIDPCADSITMPYYLARDQSGQVALSIRRNRMVKRSKNFKWIGAVHEYLEVNGYTIDSDVAITHLSLKPCSDRNLRIYEGLIAKGVPFSPRDLYYYANELMDHGKHEQAISFHQEFLATKQGWVEDNIAACGRMADCYLALNNYEKYQQCIYKSFDYDRPRPEFCCRLGYHFLQQNQLNQAIFWYVLATEFKQPLISWGVVNHACSTWLPHLQLCVCYDTIGDYEAAYKHNEIAAGFVPNDARILHNRNYLKGKAVKSTNDGIVFGW